MQNVIRKDIVQISVETDSSGLDELNKKVNKVTNAVTAIDDGLNDTSDAIKRVGKANGLENAADDAKELSDNADKAGKELDDVANTKFNKLTGGLNALSKKLTNIAGKAAKISLAAIGTGIAAGAGAVGKITFDAVQAFADFEQNVGGVEKLFGTGGKNLDEYAKSLKKSTSAVKADFNKLIEAQNTVFKNANDSYKLGFSANDYMETVTGFSASLITDLGGDTKKAAELADMAIQDMADNANVFGTDMETVRNVYQALAKNQYQVLDNLKLGYGGTKEGAEKLIADAAKLDKSIKENDLSFSNMVKAINVVQKNMGILGATEKEAAGTITGSLNATKAAWGNLLIAIGSGENLDQCMNNMVDAVETFGKNVIPVAERALVGIGTVIERLTPIVSEKLPVLAKQLLPPLINAAISLFKSFAKALPDLVKVIFTTLADIFKEQFPELSKMFSGLADGSKTITKFIPVILSLVAAFKLLGGINSISNTFSGLFGKASSGNGNPAQAMTKPFSGFANIKVTTVLKGIANITIILAAMTVLVAVFAPIAKEIAEIADFKSIIEVVAIIGILGVVGAALTKAAGTIGNIPVAIVAKGLANIAIIVAGISALFLLIGAISLLDFDYKRMLAIVGIIGVLGTVSAVLAVFAGIVGLIPIPVVLLGLANMALIMAGITAVIIAFGAISQIPGIDFFVNEGGKLLVKIFNVLGECVGAIIGGLGEGISNSLPAIGENLAQFGKNVKPLFDIMSGVDMSGVGAFFTGLAALFAASLGNDVWSKVKSIFGDDESSFATLGKELSNFATNSKEFFNVVATLPDNGFTQATKLFDCLAGVKNLPKEGGVKGWFTGNINYTSLANGLGQLSSEKVVNFFKATANLSDTGFTQATKLFDCLAGLKSLPKEGGVKGWFSGDISWDNIATNLPKVGEAAKSFFTSISGINDFSLMSKLFTELKNASSILGKDGGLWDKIGDFFSGDEGSGMATMASGLKSFATNTKEFFKLVNSDTVNNIQKFWSVLASPNSIKTDALDALETKLSDIVKKVEKLPKQMGDGLKKSGDELKNSLVSIWVEAAKAMAAPVNKIISGANWILNQFGSDEKVVKWTPYAKGTNGHKGGNAVVNDGRGAELIQMPNGNTFMPKGKDVFIPNAPKGMKVLSAEQTAKLFGKKSPTFSYANGTGEIDLWNYIDNAKGLVSAINDKFVDYDGLSGYTLNASKSMVATVSDGMVEWVDDLFDELGNIKYDASKGVKQWLPVVTRALKMENQYSMLNVAKTLFQMQTESGGNPNAINLWDSNAKKGIPSKGLMQVIDPTFKSYAKPGFNKNIYDPLSNILASIRYAVSRYGSLTRAYRGVGYANGGIATKASIFGEDGPEMAIPLTRDKRKRGIELWQQTGRMLGISAYSPETDRAIYNQTSSTEYNTYSPQFSITITGSNDDRVLARKVKRFVQEGINECFESISRQSPKLREI